jgi:hypothetical protein
MHETFTAGAYRVRLASLFLVMKTPKFVRVLYVSYIKFKAACDRLTVL